MLEELGPKEFILLLEKNTHKWEILQNKGSNATLKSELKYISKNETAIRSA